MTDQRDLNDLIRRARAGDREAFADLVEVTQGPLMRVLKRMGLQHADCEDAAVMTYADAWEQLGQVREPSQLVGWLIRIAIRKGWKVAMRNDRREVEVDLDPESAPEDERERDRDGTLWVREVIETLPEDMREVFDLRFLQGRSLEEIASRTDRRDHQVSYLLQRGLERLRWRISGRGG